MFAAVSSDPRVPELLLSGLSVVGSTCGQFKEKDDIYLNMIPEKHASCLRTIFIVSDHRCAILAVFCWHEVSVRFVPPAGSA